VKVELIIDQNTSNIKRD